MDLAKALARGVEIETLCWRIYDHLHHFFLEDDEAAAVFAKMRDEEAEHAAVIREKLDFVRSVPEAYSPVDDEVHITLESTINQLQRILQDIDAHPPSIEEALRTSMNIEEEVEGTYERVIENLIRTKGKGALATIAVEVVKLQENPEHEAALYDLAKKRGVIQASGKPNDRTGG